MCRNLPPQIDPIFLEYPWSCGFPFHYEDPGKGESDSSQLERPRDHGLGGYESYFSGRLIDYPLPEDEMRKSLKAIEGLPRPKALKKGKPV